MTTEEKNIMELQGRIILLQDFIGRLVEPLSIIRASLAWQEAEARNCPSIMQESMQVAHNRIICASNVDTMLDAIDMVLNGQKGEEE